MVRDHLFIPWGGLEAPMTLNAKVGDANDKMLKILHTPYLQPYRISPTENPVSDDNNYDKDKYF